jgi:hypothetical protein
MKSKPSSSDQLASAIVREYDFVVRSFKSGDMVAGNTVIKGNTRAMERWIRVIFKQQSKSVVPLEMINLISYGYVLYWTGAKLSLAKPPALCPIPGGVNISLVSNDVIFPGKPPYVRYRVGNPMTSEQFVDFLIIAAQQHLPTITGLMQVSWIYPTAPPGGGIAPSPWTGYRVPMQLPSAYTPPVKVPFV